MAVDEVRVIADGGLLAKGGVLGAVVGELVAVVVAGVVHPAVHLQVGVEAGVATGAGEACVYRRRQSVLLRDSHYVLFVENSFVCVIVVLDLLIYFDIAIFWILVSCNLLFRP